MDPKTTYYDNGVTRRIAYFNEEGLRSNFVGKPAYTGYHPDGSLKSTSYWVNGNRHHVNGPSYTSYHPNGITFTVAYWEGGVRHRTDGPALVEYNDDGSLRTEEYFINGEPVPKSFFVEKKTVKKVKPSSNKPLSKKNNNDILNAFMNNAPGMSFTAKQMSKKLFTDDKQSYLSMTRDDAVDAAYRIAGTQLSKAVKQGIVTLLEKNEEHSKHIESIKTMLDTEIGEALVSMILGMGLSFTPKLTENERAQRLAKEFRVNGMAVAGNAAFNAALKEVLPMISSAISSLPKAEGVRVSEEKTEFVEETIPEEEENKKQHSVSV